MESRKREEAGPSSFSGEEQKNQNVAEDEHHQDDEEEEETIGSFSPGPLLSLKDQIEKDKEDESLRRWKEKLLGCLESDINGKTEPEVKFHSIGIISSEFGEITAQLPINECDDGAVLFTLKEGSEYQLKLTFSVLHNIVSGLAYTNTVWKGGLQVDESKGMVGTFAPQREPYVHALEEETTPSGVIARGVYKANLKFVDDDKRCYLDLNYSFEITKGK